MSEQLRRLFKLMKMMRKLDSTLFRNLVLYELEADSDLLMKMKLCREADSRVSFGEMKFREEFRMCAEFVNEALIYSCWLGFSEKFAIVGQPRIFMLNPFWRGFGQVWNQFIANRVRHLNIISFY
ncbi:unnamed protein product [Vicia faba]|uniref:Uncharacterized protein n=1 Tax=Vicia faba TaxID=3906 RepID=A0AAV0YXS7_VICFA|nr:unnamed protein product [Vicia faba]